MQFAARPYITAGVALATASLIAVTPVAPALPDIQIRAVQLTAGIDDLTDPYSDLFTHTFANLQDLGQTWAADPAPFVRQVFDNQIGYGQAIAGALQSGNFESVSGAISDVPKTMAQNLLNVIHTLTDTSVGLDTSNLIGDINLPPVEQIGSALLSGDVHGLLQGIIDGAIGHIDLNMGLPLALAVDAIGAPYFGMNALMESGTTFANAVQAGDPLTAFSTLFTSPATITDAFLNGQGIALDDALDSLGIPLGDLLGGLDLSLGSVAIPGGTANLGDLSLLGVNGSIPLGGLLAPLGHPTLGADLGWSGAKAVFDPVCVLLCGTKWAVTITAPPLSIAGGTFSVSPEIGGTPIGGLVPALVNWAPSQLADAITGTVPGSWEDIATQFQDLPTYLWDQFQLTSLLGDEGWLGLLTSGLGLGDFSTLFDPTMLNGLLDPTMLGLDLVPNLLSALLAF